MLSPRTVKSFRQSQRLSAYRLGFSVTRACPLRCAHCSVSADKSLGATSFSPAFARKVVSEMGALKETGIQFIDFTGGEPTIVPDFVIPVAEAAKAYGIQTGITTAAPWATNEHAVRKIIRRYSCIDHWDISTDVYHLDFVPLKNVELAFRLFSEIGKPPLIRIAYHEPMTIEDALLIDATYRFAHRRIGFQQIGPVGRGETLVANPVADMKTYDKGPCPSTGVLIQAWGAVAPCCAPLSHEDYEHPMRLGNAFTEPLTTIIDRWRIHPLLQTIRIWGFKPLINWLQEAAMPFESILRDRACNLCVELVRNRALCDYVTECASTFEHKVKVAYVLKKFYKETWMEQEVMAEAARILQNEPV